ESEGTGELLIGPDSMRTCPRTRACIRQTMVGRADRSTLLAPGNSLYQRLMGPTFHAVSATARPCTSVFLLLLFHLCCGPPPFGSQTQTASFLPPRASPGYGMLFSGCCLLLGRESGYSLRRRIHKSAPRAARRMIIRCCCGPPTRVPRSRIVAQPD